MSSYAPTVARTHLLLSAAAESRGLHSGKDQPAPKQPLNISEVSALLNAIRPSSHLLPVAQSGCALPEQLQAVRQSAGGRRLRCRWLTIQVGPDLCGTVGY